LLGKRSLIDRGRHDRNHSVHSHEAPASPDKVEAMLAGKTVYPISVEIDLEKSLQAWLPQVQFQRIPSG
jgi:hypothetical protein